MSTIATTADTARAKRAAALLQFTQLRLQAATILETAGLIDGLAPIYRAQAEAAAKLAKTRLHRVHGEACADDAHALIEDLQALWTIVDPLVDAVGLEAAQNFPGIERGHFQHQLREALEGNATYAIETASGIANDDRGALSIDPTREHRAHAGAV